MYVYVRMCVHVHAYVHACTYDVYCSLLQLLDKMESSLIPLISTIFEKGILGEGGKVEGRRQEASPVYDLQHHVSCVLYSH